MDDTRIRIRLNKSLGELEIDAPAEIAKEWWDRLWPELSEQRPPPGESDPTAMPRGVQPSKQEAPGIFGEFFSEFPAQLTDVDKVLIAGVFAQTNDAERSFTTKTANQMLMDQNIKVTNASECVRRLVQAKRAFVVSDGKFRISASGLEYLQSLRVGS